MYRKKRLSRQEAQEQVLIEAGILPPYTNSGEPFNWDAIDDYLITEKHISPLELSRLTIPETLSLLPKQDGYATFQEGARVALGLRQLNTDQLLRLAELMDG